MPCKYPRNQGFFFYRNRAGIFRSKLGWPAAKTLSYLSAKPNLQCGYGVWPATQKKFLGPYSAFRGDYNYHATSLLVQIQLGSGQCIEDTVTFASIMKR